MDKKAFEKLLGESANEVEKLLLKARESRKTAERVNIREAWKRATGEDQLGGLK